MPRLSGLKLLPTLRTTGMGGQLIPSRVVKHPKVLKGKDAMS